MYNLLEVVDSYPSAKHPSSSNWVFEQVVSLQNYGLKPFVISPTPIIPFRRLWGKKFIAYDTPSNKIEDYNSTTVLRPPYIKLPFKYNFRFTLNQLESVIFRNGKISDVKIIHAHYGQNGIASLKLKNYLNVPLVTSFYGYDSGRLGSIFKKFYPPLICHGDAFLALSNNMKFDLIDLGFPEQKIIIHHLGVDVNKFHPKVVDSKKDPNKIILSTIARFVPLKGIHLVLKALGLLFKQHNFLKDVIFYRIVGDGPFEPFLKKLVAALNLQNNVTFINNLNRTNSRSIVIEEMQKCDIFCLCSSTSSDGAKEGTPVVLIEAQSCGKPCIGTFHSGIPEVVIDGFTGLLVKEHCIEEIAFAIEKLALNNEMRLKYSYNARNHILQNFNHDIQMDSLIKLYKKLMY